MKMNELQLHFGNALREKSKLQMSTYNIPFLLSKDDKTIFF